MLGTYYLLKGFSVSTGLAWATGRHRFPHLHQDGGWQPSCLCAGLTLGSLIRLLRWALPNPLCQPIPSEGGGS